jgi:hypothetical protein
VAEQEKLEQHLLKLLGIAKWKGARRTVESPEYSDWVRCNNGATSAGGNLVIVSSVADKHVKDAADALHDELNKIQISTLKTNAPPDALNLTCGFLGADFPSVMVIKDPTSAFLLVGANPMFDWLTERSATKDRTIAL